MRAAGPQSVLAGDVQFREARNAVYVVFFGNGFLFANWASRIPQVRAELGVTPGVLGLILGCLAVGSGIGTSLGRRQGGRAPRARPSGARPLLGACSAGWLGFSIGQPV